MRSRAASLPFPSCVGRFAPLTVSARLCSPIWDPVPECGRPAELANLTQEETATVAK